ncbi:MAG: tyrosine-protein phosphatase, partial [Acidobacteriota bacterium]|nr:tyrosine-protein phosphatase [Acidobacteriota bacterium]
FELLHFPILDMGVAPARSVADLCSKILGAIFDHRPVLLHCRAGLGRTGTIGACCLVSLGLTAEDAIRSLRTRSRLYIQTESQENMIGHYADHLHSLVDAGTLPDLFSPPGTLGLHSLSKRLAESGLSINGSRG